MTTETASPTSPVMSPFVSINDESSDQQFGTFLHTLETSLTGFLNNNPNLLNQLSVENLSRARRITGIFQEIITHTEDRFSESPLPAATGTIVPKQGRSISCADKEAPPRQAAAIAAAAVLAPAALPPPRVSYSATLHPVYAALAFPPSSLTAASPFQIAAAEQVVRERPDIVGERDSRRLLSSRELSAPPSPPISPAVLAKAIQDLEKIYRTSKKGTERVDEMNRLDQFIKSYPSLADTLKGIKDLIVYDRIKKYEELLRSLKVRMAHPRECQ